MDVRLAHLQGSRLECLHIRVAVVVVLAKVIWWGNVSEKEWCGVLMTSEDSTHVATARINTRAKGL